MGSLADWVAGVGAVSALVFARSAAMSARRASDLQARQIERLQTEDHEREDRRRRELAATVAVYIGVKKDSGAPAPVVRFVNSGDLPIYGLTVTCFTPSTILERRYFVSGPQSERRTLEALTARLTEILAGSDLSALVGAGRVVAACSFTDATGFTWYRTTRGALHEAADEQAALAAVRASGPGADLPVETLAG